LLLRAGIRRCNYLQVDVVSVLDLDS